MTDCSPVVEGARRARSRIRPCKAARRGKELASAALYRLLALAVSFPEAGTVRQVIGGCGELMTVSKQRTFPPRVARALKAWNQAWRAAAAGNLPVEYSRLFLGAGLVPLREGGFGDGLRFAGQPASIADVSGFYLAFGFELPAFSANPPDHLGTELEFMSLLHLKLALSLGRRRLEHVRVTRSAMAGFLKDHLGCWAGPFGAALENTGAAPAYGTMARLLARTVEADCATLNVQPLKACAGSGEDPVGGEQLACAFAGRIDREPVPGRRPQDAPGALALPISAAPQGASAQI